MKKKISKYVTGMLSVVVCIGTAITSCTYDSREDIVPMVCDTTSVTYALTIKQILTGNCVECHSTTNPAGGLNFETYSDLSAASNDGRLIGSIKHLPGYTPMPQFSPMLPDCEIQKIQKWVTDGASNN